jgi:hypothetical protein
MKHTIILGAAAAALLASVQPASAQGGGGYPERGIVPPAGPPAPAAASDIADAARTILGLTVTTSGTDRDTLGLLVSAVIPGAPADRSAVEPGSRLGEINGVSLRIDPADVGRRESQDGAMRRLARELHAVQPGDVVTLRLYSGGRYRTVSVKTTKAPEAAPATVATRPASLQGVIDAIDSARAQLHRVMQAGSAPVSPDTLLRSDGDLAAVERRLRAALEPRRSDTSSAIPGIRVSVVAGELADYFGEGTEGGLLVLACDSSWSPVRQGDVILRVNGEAADLDRLRDAADPRRPIRIDLVRRGRSLTITLHPLD